MANALFYLMAFGVITLSLGVILSKNPVKAVLSLLGTFFCLATIYLLAGFQFMAAAQILVYAGAIMVLFLFVIMLLNLGDDTREKLLDTQLLKSRGLTMAMAVTSGGLGAVLLAIGSKSTNVPNPGQPAEGIGSPDALAKALFLENSLAFEGIGVLLLTTTIAVLVLAKRERKAAAPPHAAVAQASPPEPAAPTEEREPVLAGGDR